VIWLTWRQQRFEFLLACGALLGASLMLLWTGEQILMSFKLLGIAPCLRGIGDATACSNAISDFTSNVTSQQPQLSWLVYLPILIGALLAAPIALEMEQGTYRLAWTQSVTRSRWAIVRLGAPILVGLGIGSLVATMSSWSMEPVNRVQGALRPGSFDVQGVVPVAYLLLTFAVTVTVAVLLRRVLPALALGVGLVVVLHLAVMTWLRPKFISPISSIWLNGPAPFGPRDWVIQGGTGSTSYVYVDLAGDHITLAQAQALCGQVTDAASKNSWSSCLQARHLGELIQYQPADRFWAFQAIETALIAGMALAFLAISVWWLRKRMT
jgi:hypothetical protein